MKRKMLVGVAAWVLTAGWGSVASAQTVLPGLAVSGNTATDQNQVRGNTAANNLLNEGSGIATVQQNNGNNNIVGGGTVVQANLATGNSPLTLGALADGASVDGSASQSGGQRTNTLSGSANNFSGIVTVQQNNGDNNVLVSSTTVIARTNGHSGDVTESTAANGTAGGTTATVLSSDQGSLRNNGISSSADSLNGIATVSQNNGSGNVVSQSTAVAANIGAGNVTQTTSSTATLGNSSLGNDSTRANAVQGSFGGMSGIATVSQNNGDNNVIASATAVVANQGNTLASGTAGTTTTQDTSNLATPTGALAASEGHLSAGGGTRANSLAGSFGQFAGIATVAQNNGGNNVIESSTAVVASTDTTGGAHGQTALQNTSNKADMTNYATASEIGLPGATTPGRANSLDGGSFAQAGGIVSVSQNNGDNNVVQNATSVVATQNSSDRLTGVQGTTTVNTAYLGDHHAEDINTQRANTLGNAFANGSGILSVVQNNGSNNALQTATSVAANQGDGRSGYAYSAASNNAGSGADTTAAFGAPASLDHQNAIQGGAFGNATGIVTVIQNNGDNNALQSANAVAANLGRGGFTQTDNAATNSAILAADGGGALATSGGSNSLGGGAFNEAAGLVTTIQNNGTNNAVQVANAVAANGGGNSAASPQATTSTATDQAILSVNGSARLLGNNSVNGIGGGAFANAAGLLTAVQNNGANNAVQVANTVTANIGGTANGQASDYGNSVTNGSIQAIGSNGTNTLNGNAFNNASGIVTAVQNNGANNIVQTATSVTAASQGGQPGPSVATAGASTTSTELGNIAHAAYVTGTNTLGGSAFNEAQGILSVQQNNGNGNTLQTATSVVADLNGGGYAGALVQPGASATVTGNSASYEGVHLNNSITGGAFDNAAGIVTVIQNNGDNNSLGASTAVAVNGNSGFVGALSGGSLAATVSGNAVTNPGLTPASTNVASNTLSGAFRNASGIITIQQNNGANNALLVSTSVVAIK